MFYEELEKRHMNNLFEGTAFKKIMPIGAQTFLTWIKDIVDNGKSVWIDQDCDPDGYFSALNIKTMFDAIRHPYYNIPVHIYKRHTLDLEYVKNVLRQNTIDYFIIVDSSSNSPEVLQYLVDKGLRVIVIDHHATNTKRDQFGPNCLLINPKIDTKEKGITSPLQEMSAGALTSLLVDLVVKKLYPEAYGDLNGAHWVYGYITLYSDSCAFNMYNIAYARQVINSNFVLPPIVEFFIDKYSSLNRSFVSFKMIPRINALMRGEHYNIAWSMFFDFEEFLEKYSLEDIERIYQESKAYVVDLTNRSKVTNLGSFVFLEMPSEVKARNYTGLVASGIVKQYNLPCLSVIDMGQGEYEGSVRDVYARNLLTLFKTVCDADGHAPAFGVHFPKEDLQDILYSIRELSSELETTQDVIFQDWNGYTGNERELLNDIALMAEYNEYAGQGLPQAYGTIKITSKMKIRRYEKVTYIQWGKQKLVVFNKYILEGDTAIVQPALDITGAKLYINNVVYNQY